MTSRSRPADEAWKLMLDLFREERHRFVAATGEYGLLPPHVFALQALDAEEAVPMRDLAAQLRCDPSNATGLVDRLEERGLAERRPSSEDRRVKLLALTPRGVEVRAAIEAQLHEAPAGLRALSGEEQRVLRDLLRRAGARD
jgi:DNA-binding MarR family transcriptional regulator